MGLPSITETALLSGRIGEDFAATVIAAVIADMLTQFVVLATKGLLALLPAKCILLLGRLISCQAGGGVAVAAPAVGDGHGRDEDVERAPLVAGAGSGAGALRVTGSGDVETGAPGAPDVDAPPAIVALAEGQEDSRESMEAHRRLRSMLSIVEYVAVPWRLLVVLPMWVVYLSQPPFGRTSSILDPSPSSSSGGSHSYNGGTDEGGES